MSSALAKQRKRLKRTGMTDAQAEGIIKAINETSQAKRKEARAMSKEIAEKSYERLKKEYIPEIQGEIILYVLAYLRCECGYGAKRIRDFIHGFNAFADVMRMDGTHSPQIVQMLREECGVDIVREFELCDIETERERRKMRSA